MATWLKSIKDKAVIWTRVAGDVMFGKLYAMIYHPADIASPPHVADKVFVVTGATSGIGTDTAKRLALNGGIVVLAVRNVAAGQELIDEWNKTNPEIKVFVCHLDLCSLESVRKCAEEIKQKFKHCDVLINNAGLFAMTNPNRELTEDGYERHFQVNFLAPALFTQLMLPLLSKSESPVIVNVSSIVQHSATFNVDNWDLEIGYSQFDAYANSKLLQLMHTYEMHRVLSDAKAPIKVYALHPGAIVTNIGRTLPALIRWLYARVAPALLLTPSRGSETTLYAASHPELHSEVDWAYLSYCCESDTNPAMSDPKKRQQLWKRTNEALGLDQSAWLNAWHSLTHSS
eukprot:m.93729 g.93729  ORF g.93729 m.93729 type:complete len:344 (-) comp13007_c0_seq2:135-1166(-)